MKFVFKGKLNDINDLPTFELPKNAVPYDEPNTLDELVEEVMPWHLPLISFVLVGLIIRFLLHTRESVGDHILELMPTLPGVLLIIPLFFLHEFIHGLCFPKDATVYCYSGLRQGILLVTSDKYLSKKRFVFISVVPLLLLGVIPFLIWVFYPETTYVTRTLMTFSPILILAACGDVMNIYNTIKQVPNGAKIALSGMNTYWFFPEDS